MLQSITAKKYLVRPRVVLGVRNPAILYATKRSFSLFPSTPSTKDLLVNNLRAQEQAANEALDDPVTQNRFYQTLLNSNYPQVVIARYESPGIARSPDTDTLYLAALRQMGQTEKAARIESKLHKVSEAPLSHSMASQMYTNNPLSLNVGTSKEPIHVVISEPILSTILKWLKWLVPLGFVGWAVYSVRSFLNESGILEAIGKGSASDGLSSKMADEKNGTQSTVKFSDVQGVDEAKHELEEIVAFLKDPSKFNGLGGQLPKGILLTGPPGTGKTLLARAVAGEAGVPFFFMSGSEFDELYVGVGAQRVRELFTAARTKAPAIIFIDELDAIGAKRNPKDPSYSRQTLNQLLVELDGFNQTTGVIFIAATNFPDVLDKALTRPGRFDKTVHVELPDVRGRIAILEHHMKKVETSTDADPSLLARGTSGFSGADLMNLVNQAAIYASHVKAQSVNMDHFEWAKDKILLGAARKTMVLTEESRKNTAFHEAGHAIMALYTPGATSLYKATILPRGTALGLTFQLPDMDKYDETKRELCARLDVCMGGKIAEEILNGPDNVTSGCSSDLQAATQVARAMVTSFGMSEAIGPVQLSENWSEWSAATRSLAEQEIKRLLVESENRTRKMLTEKNTELYRLAHGLLEYETLNKEEIEKVVDGLEINKKKTITNIVVKSEDIKDKRGENDIKLDTKRPNKTLPSGKLPAEE